MREIVLDTETTGLSPEKGDRVFEIGAVELINHIPTQKKFHTFINPKYKMSADSKIITGISDEFLIGKPLFSDIVDEFLDFIKDDTLVIHNAKFDVKFLNHELQRIEGLTYRIHMDRCVDTWEIARNKFPGSPSSLDALCRRFNINNSKRVKHGALIDSEFLAEVYIHLLGGPQGGLLLSDSMGVGNKMRKNTATDSANQLRMEPRSFPKRIFTPHESELVLHNLYINTIKNALWNKV